MAPLFFIVSRAEPTTYTYIKHVFADREGDASVILDRREHERRRSQTQTVRQTERRHVVRRHRDVTSELQSMGWAVVRCVGNPMTTDATRCVAPGCQEEGVVGLNGAWLCLRHFEIRAACRNVVRWRPRWDARVANMKCARCLQVLSPDDTFEVKGHHLVHLDCRKPRDLNREERALLFKHCDEHVVATCPTCNQELRQNELASDLIGNGTHLCPRCRVDLAEQLREHLYDCTMLPGEVRCRAREARAANQRLLKESQQVIDRADVLMRETEATLAAHRALLREARTARDALRETLHRRKPR